MRGCGSESSGAPGVPDDVDVADPRRWTRFDLEDEDGAVGIVQPGPSG